MTPLARKLSAGAVAAVLMLALLYSGLKRGPSEPGNPTETSSTSSTSSPEDDPLQDAEAQLRSLLDRGREGDVPGYLSAFAEPLRSRFEREADERGLDRFAADLREAAKTRKSHAIFAPKADGPDACQITVETVYPDRNERQTYRLERADSGWLVSSIDTVNAREPIARYGTPAAYLAPEGVPVQASDVVPTDEQ